MKPLPYAISCLAHFILTSGKVCRLALVVICLAAAIIVCQNVKADLVITDENIGSYDDVNYGSDNLIFNITGDVTNSTIWRITGSGTVYKKGSGSLNLQGLMLFSSVENVVVNAGEFILSRDCFFHANVEITKDANNTGTFTVATPDMGGSDLRNLTGNGELKLENANAVGARLLNTRDSEFSGVISGTGNLRKLGDYTLTLSGANTFTGNIEITQGSLTLKDGAIAANGEIIGYGSELTFEVSSGERLITITSSTRIYNEDKLVKTGNGALKIISEAQDGVQAESWVISSGRIDCEGYFGTFPDGIEVESGATISAGNTVGEYKTRGSDIIIKSAGIALFEFDSYSPDEQNYDMFVIGDGPDYTFTLEEGAIVELAFLRNDAESWAKEGAVYQLVDDSNFAKNQDDDIIDYSSLLRGAGSNLFLLEGRKGQGLFLKYNPNPVFPEVPEPSTWALLALGVIGLFCLRKLR